LKSGKLVNFFTDLWIDDTVVDMFVDKDVQALLKAKVVRFIVNNNWRILQDIVSAIKQQITNLILLKISH